MKTLFRTRNWLLLIPVFLACALVIAYAINKSGYRKAQVNLEIKVHPTINLSTDDEKALTDALASYDKALYRFVALTDGKVDEKRSIGQLLVDKELKAEIERAQAKGANVFAGMTTPCGGTATSRDFTQEDADQSMKLTQAILPILGKYQVSNEKH